MTTAARRPLSSAPSGPELRPLGLRLRDESHPTRPAATPRARGLAAVADAQSLRTDRGLEFFVR